MSRPLWGLAQQPVQLRQQRRGVHLGAQGVVRAGGQQVLRHAGALAAIGLLTLALGLALAYASLAGLLPVWLNAIDAI